MKKSIIISAIALSFSVATLNAETVTDYNTLETESTIYSVNSFCKAIATGDIATVRKLISLGEDVNKKSNGMTPAMYAARSNRVEILKLLIARGANLKATSDKGMTAIKYAERSKALDAIAIIKSTLGKKK